LTGSATDPGDDTPFTYAWSVTKDGNPYTLPSGTNVSDSTFTFTPDDNGTWVATLTVTDVDGASTSVSQTIDVLNVNPTVTITGAPTTSQEGTQINLGSSVSDPGTHDDPFTYNWSVTKNGVAYDTGTNSSFSFTPDDNGIYIVTLTATDKDGGTSAA